MPKTGSGAGPLPNEGVPKDLVGVTEGPLAGIAEGLLSKEEAKAGAAATGAEDGVLNGGALLHEADAATAPNELLGLAPAQKTKAKCTMIFWE